MDLLSLLFPRRCIGCKELGGYICPDCINSLVPMQQWYCPYCRKPSRWGKTHIACKKLSSLDGLLSCYPYVGLMVKMVTKFKNYFVQDLVNTLVEMMISNTGYPLLFRYQWMIVPVPLHVSRRKWRGFNQAEVLAEGLAKAWDWPYSSKLLIRKRSTEPQMKLSGKKLKNNLRGAFKINVGMVPSKRVLLIDDVVVTGSTLNECAKVLKKAGVREVWGLTLAQKLLE